MPATAVAPSTSGRPAATTAPNATSRMISSRRVGDELRLLAVLRVLGGDRLGGRDLAELLDAHAGMGGLDGGHCGERLRRRASRRARPCRASSKFTTTERPSLETVLTRVAGSSGLSISVMPSIRSRRLTTSLTAAVTSRIAGPDGALALHEHLLARLLGEARGLDDHVAALGLAAAPRRLVEVVLADLAADTAARTTNSDPAEDGRPAVLGAPSTGTRCEVTRLHCGLLGRGSYAVRSTVLVRCTMTKGG